MAFLRNAKQWRGYTFQDPVEQQLAPFLFWFLIGSTIAIVLLAPIFLLVVGPVQGGVIVGGQAIAEVLIIVALVVLWRGNFRQAVIYTAVGLFLGVSFVFFFPGHSRQHTFHGCLHHAADSDGAANWPAQYGACGGWQHCGGAWCRGAGIC